MSLYVSKQIADPTATYSYEWGGNILVSTFSNPDGLGGKNYYYILDNRAYISGSSASTALHAYELWNKWNREKGDKILENYSSMPTQAQEEALGNYNSQALDFITTTLCKATPLNKIARYKNFRYIEELGDVRILERMYQTEAQQYRYDYATDCFLIFIVSRDATGYPTSITEHLASSFTYDPTNYPDSVIYNYSSVYHDETLAKTNMESGDGTNVPTEEVVTPETGQSNIINPIYFNFPIGSSDDAIKAASNWINDLEVIAEIDQTNMGKIAAALNQVWNPSGANMTDAILLVARSILQKNLAEGILSIKMIAIPAQASLPYKSPTRLLFNPLGLGAVEGHPIDHFHKYSLGSMKINPLFDDYKDFLCDYSIYLPFAGIYRLDPSIIVNTTLSIMCDIDFITGSILYHIIVDDTVTQRDIYTFSGNCCIEFPITATDYSEKATALTNAIFGVAEAGAGIAAGGAGAGLVVSGVMKGLNAAMPAQPHYVQSSKLIPNSAMLSVLYPYLIISKPIDKTPEHLVDIKGLPTHKVLSLDEVSGYCVIQDIDIENIAYATSNEIDEIKSLLQAGAYF